MSVEGFYREHYTAVRSRLMGVPCKSKMIEIEEEPEPEELYVKIMRREAEAKRKKERLQQAVIDSVIIAKAEGRRAPAGDIIRAVAYRHGFKYSDLIGPSRKRTLVKARQEAIHEIKLSQPTISLPAIGRLMGGRDHTTILHALRKPYKSPYDARIHDEIVSKEDLAWLEKVRQYD